MQFSKRLDRFGSEVFASLNARRRELEASGRTVIDLSVGTPDFEPPAHVKNALVEAAKDSENWKYALADLPELTQAVNKALEDMKSDGTMKEIETKWFGSEI